MNNSLAIIIPAYKQTFLEEALQSIANQTCKDFTLYIGDDCSPYDLESIVDKFRDKINIVYKRFESNLGGKDLVAQWERSIDLSQEEEWIWLFSDDDVMDPNCVYEFYKLIEKKQDIGLVHFNINEIKGKDRIVVPLKEYPDVMTCKDYVDSKLSGSIVSYVVEFIVRRDIFYNTGRFERYDQAWGSDFMSWVKFSDEANGIYTVKTAKVSWRSSGENISTNMSNESLYRKMKSVVKYTHCLYLFSQEHGWGHPFFYSKFALGELNRKKQHLSKSQYKNLKREYWRLMKPYAIKIFIDILRYPFYKLI